MPIIKPGSSLRNQTRDITALCHVPYKPLLGFKVVDVRRPRVSHDSIAKVKNLTASSFHIGKIQGNV